jgi:hypothetical protein
MLRKLNLLTFSGREASGPTATLGAQTLIRTAFCVGDEISAPDNRQAPSAFLNTL